MPVSRRAGKLSVLLSERRAGFVVGVDAWILDQSPGEYRWGSINTPAPGADDVLVEVKASGLNHMDHWLTQGRPRPPVPHVPGCDVAGVIVEVGSEVTNVAVGSEVVVNPALVAPEAIDRLGIDACLDRSLAVVGEHRWGGHGEFLAVPARFVEPRPSGLTWAEAAAFPVAALTAHRMLRRGRAAAGETVLIIGIGGGVATAALALAVHAGCDVVVTSRSAAKREQALALGASRAVDSSDEDWGVSADLVLDSVGPATWTQAVGSLTRGGRLVTCGGTSGQILQVSLPILFWRQHELIGSSMGSPAEFAEVCELIGHGVRLPVDEVFPLAEYPKALRRLREGGQLGTVVLDHTV